MKKNSFYLNSPSKVNSHRSFSLKPNPNRNDYFLDIMKEKTEFLKYKWE